MGWSVNPMEYLNFKVKKEIHIKIIEGKCPMCGTELPKRFDLMKDDEYKCPCGYFTLYLDRLEVSVDNHNIPKEEWVEKLKVSN